MSGADTPGRAHEIAVAPDERATGALSAESFRVAALLLHTRGYVVLKGAVPGDVAGAAAEAFARVYRDCVASKDGGGWYQVARDTQAVFWERNRRWRIFPKLHPPFDSPWLVANPFATQLLRFFLRDGYYCKFVSSDTCLNGAELQSPHREMDAGRAWEPRGLIANVPLCVCGLDNGPLEVWPAGTHLWRADLLDELKLGLDVQDGRNPDAEWFATLFPARRVTLEPGDLLLRDPALLHRGTVNHTDAPRSVLTICYFRRGLTFDYGRAEYNLDRATWEWLAPDVRALFAHAFEAPVVAPPSGFWRRLRARFGRRAA
jgi:hypothetical protein